MKIEIYFSIGGLTNGSACLRRFLWNDLSITSQMMLKKSWLLIDADNCRLKHLQLSANFHRSKTSRFQELYFSFHSRFSPQNIIFSRFRDFTVKSCALSFIFQDRSIKKCLSEHIYLYSYLFGISRWLACCFTDIFLRLLITHSFHS